MRRTLFPTKARAYILCLLFSFFFLSLYLSSVIFKSIFFSRHPPQLLLATSHSLIEFNPPTFFLEENRSLKYYYIMLA